MPTTDQRNLTEARVREILSVVAPEKWHLGQHTGW
jgi:hypothetical protein